MAAAAERESESEGEADGCEDSGDALAGPNSAVRARWAAEQTALQLRVLERDDADYALERVQRVAGVDISFVKSSRTLACAAFVVLALPDLREVYAEYKMIRLEQPYIPGFLAFREVPFLHEAVERLRASRPELMPQCVLVDGNGVMHPRGFGLACHLGVLSDVPCIGVAKKLLAVDGLTRDGVRALEGALGAGGDHVPLRGQSGRVWGALVRTTERSHRPLFVSVGHRMSLESAVNLVVRCSRTRMPEPVRRADLGSRAVIRDYLRDHPEAAAGSGSET